jgi:hypothetical protein
MGVRRTNTGGLSGEIWAQSEIRPATPRERFFGSNIVVTSCPVRGEAIGMVLP